MRIFLDMDGVVASFMQGAIDLLGLPITEADVDQWNIHLNYVEHEYFLRLIQAAGLGFWANLPLYRWSKEIVELCQEFDPGFHFLTSHGDFPSATAGKSLWVRTHFKWENMLATREKDLLAGKGKVLIDDKPANCDAFERAGGKSILFERPWNSKVAEQYLSATPSYRSLRAALRSL